ncbi:MAG: hypothetical protein ABIH46_05230 [Chloroflexota bacterium]
MHFMPDTEDADSAAETFWPDGYKQVIREEVRPLLHALLDNGRRLRHVHQQQYSEVYPDLNQFTERIADMILIGAENGSDNAFEDIVTGFLTESPLPEVRRYARYLPPQAFPPKVREKVHQGIVDEYGRDEVFAHAYKVGYQSSYRDRSAFIGRVAELAVTGTANGADDMIEDIYRSFVASCPLPPARRQPRRLKSW